MLTASVIIPTYNYAQFIGNAIDSVLRQEGIELLPQIIVVDDGSTDDTAQQLEKYIHLNQIEYVVTQQAGKAHATALGIELATGDIIFSLDADDYFLPGKIKTTLEIFENHPKVQHVASPALYQWLDGSQSDIIEPIPNQFLSRVSIGKDTLKFFFDNRMLFGGGSTFAARASMLREIPFPPQIDMYTDEWLVIQALLAGDTYFWPTPLSTWQIHSENYSVKKHNELSFDRKYQRLERSSNAILTEIKNGNNPHWLKRVYYLKHEVRKMGWKEKTGNKTLSDRFQFAKFCLLQNSFPIKWWVSYRLLNRMIY